MYRLPDFTSPARFVISGEMIRNGNAKVLLAGLDGDSGDQRETA